jgi:tRNA A22 N-methylase
MSYKEAALAIGCDHHYVRMLVSKGTISVHHTEEVRPHVLKVFVSASDVRAHINKTRKRDLVKYRLTLEEKEEVRKTLERMESYVANR